jgi:tRNA (cmo5U34)-methyltransferase
MPKTRPACLEQFRREALELVRQRRSIAGLSTLGTAGQGLGGGIRWPVREDDAVPGAEWSTVEHALSYLSRADTLPHRTEGEGVLLEQIPRGARRVLDLGTGDGRLLALLRVGRPQMIGIGLDVSKPMLVKAHERFAGDGRVELLGHDLAEPLPNLGRFDAVVSSFAIHHLEHDRKHSLYSEILRLLEPGGVFCNLEHVASPSERLHRRFYGALGCEPGEEDTSNRLLDVETQLRWLRELGFDDVDCYWKWLEMALLVGVKSAAEQQ